MERLREVWDKVNPEGAGALSYAALKRTLDDLEIDWVRTARPFPPSGASSRPASPTSLLHLSSPVNAEPSPPEIAHFRPTPRSPRAGS